jgi:hypothetical protein
MCWQLDVGVSLNSEVLTTCDIPEGEVNTKVDLERNLRAVLANLAVV